MPGVAPKGEFVGPLEVGPVAHGGHCVAHHENRVVFVRHTLPGERVLARLTDVSHDRFWRADAVQVLRASPDRVEPPCRIAGPGRCGGCDFQHVDLAAQRRLKAAVVAEQLQRLAGLAWSGEVEAVPEGIGPGRDGPGDQDGRGWRTRMRYQVDATGRAGLRRHRSHEVEPLPPEGCLIADPRIPNPADQVWPPGAALLGAAAEDGAALRPEEEVPADAAVGEQAAGRRWRVAADGFWQVHVGAADLLVSVVLEALAPRAGERALDLYAGVGLFAGALVDRGARVWAVESDRRAVELARVNLADVPDRVRVLSGRVDRMLRRLPSRCELVVLDPPRTGAGGAVVRGVLDRRPRAVAHVACDPAALARDLGTAIAGGYRVTAIRAFDLFPMTHHVECVALLEAPTA